MISRSKHRSLAAISLAILCAFPIASSFYIEYHRNAGAPAIGERMPPFAAAFADGRRFAFDSPRTRKLLILFYSPACSHCRTEIVNCDSVYKIFSNTLDVVGVCIDGSADSTGRKGSITPSFPVLAGNSIELAKSFKVAAVPSLYCIDEDGVLRQRSTGENTFQKDSLLIAGFAGTQ